jgi:hypothetical protein
MPAGRRGHKIREYKRRIDSVLEDERGRRASIPPPISEEHSALRERIAAAYRALLDPEDPGGTDLAKRVMANPKLADVAVRVLEMMSEECKLLEAQGVDWRPYQSE